MTTVIHNTPDTPITLAEAFALPAAENICLLRGGRYTGDFIASVAGIWQGRKTVFKPYNGERVIIDGSVRVLGAYLEFRDIEFTTTWPVGRTSDNDSMSSELLTNMGVSEYSPVSCDGINMSLINCVLHDGWCFAPWGSGLYMYGCLIFNNGAKGKSGGGMGHGLYAHSANSLEYPATIENCIWMANYNYTLHINSDSVGETSHYRFINNIIGKCNGKNIIACGSGPMKGIKFNGNCTWSTFINAARWSGYVGEDLEFNDNYMVGGNTVWNGAAVFKMWRKIQSRRNTWVSHLVPEILSLKYPPTGDVTYDFDENDYYTTVTGAAFMPYNRSPFTGDYLTFADWQAATGLDANSTEHRDVTPPDFVKLYPNEYDAGRANLAVYNWSEAETVVVDVSAVYQPDEVVRVHNAQDYYNDYEDVAVGQDGKITIPMTGHSVAVPTGDTEPPDGTHFPVFGAFLLEKL